MKKNWFVLSLVVALGGVLAACSHLNHNGGTSNAAELGSVSQAIQAVKTRYAPDPHLAIFNVSAHPERGGFVLKGEVDNPEARTEVIRAVEATGARVTDQIAVLPARELGDKVWGISCLSVANAREHPGHSAELGTQVLMGHVVHVWRQSNSWYLVQSSDRYLSWIQNGAFVRCTREQVDAWENSPRLIVTASEDCVRELPQPGAQPVSDVVPGCLVKKLGDEAGWFKVELPDQRSGYLPKSSAMDYGEWKRTRRPTPDAIERTAKTLLGRPYIWGGNSPKGLDCSGFTKLVYFLNGIDLLRNASQQAQQGTEIPLDSELNNLKKGDLVFFGSRARAGRPERVTHVGIYLGDKLFIHSSEMVRINSFDPNSPISDAHRIRTLLRARRMLPES